MMPSHIKNDISIEDMVVEFADETILNDNVSSPPKILNIVKTSQAPIKILNTQASLKSIEPVLRPPILKTNEDGKIEVVSEIMESDYNELDPIKSAAPVETNVFPCNYCERSFPLRQLLDIHVANHVRDRKFQCKVCNKGFFSKYDLGKHELIHTGEKPFKCVVCGKAFSRSTLLRRHEKVHSDQPKFLCAYCERPFLSKEEWEKHTQNHQKKRPFACEFCGKSFAFKQGLERHEVVHSSDQPYKCEHCDQGFSTQGKLARHLTAHAGDRPYPCRICDKSYLLSHHLTRHMRSHKENNQIAHKCTECDLSFAKRDELIAHSSLHATETMVCPLCKTTFDSVDEVSEHIKQHTEGEQFACEFCDLIFLTESQLHEHSDTQHLEEIEFYEMSNTNDDSLGGGDDGDTDEYEPIKTNNDEIVEYTEQIEVITAEETESDESPKSKPNTRSYGRPTAKPSPSAEPKKVIDIKADKLPAKETSVETNTENSLKRLSYGKTTTVDVRSTNARAPLVGVKNKSPDRAVSTRSTKISPNKTASAEKLLPTASASSGKKNTIQKSLASFVTIKSKPKEHNDAGSPPVKKVITLPTVKTIKDDANTIASPKVANKLVKVKQIRMTKAQIEALTKQGKIEMRGGQVIFKDKLSPKKK